MMKLFHQAGHNTNWNSESLDSDNAGSGIIFSPVHTPRPRLESMSQSLKSKSIFDPQFYVPDSQKPRLQSYDFFPEKLMDGFSTLNFDAYAPKAAELCLDFQLRNDFDSIVIPARYFPDLSTDFIAKQKAFTVEPFLAELSRRQTTKKIFLTLPVTVAMLRDKRYREQLLNWITSYPEIAGVYLLCQFGEETKQIRDFNKLSDYFEFIRELQNASLLVIAGYGNAEALLLTAIDPYGITMGAFENTRGFSIDKFLTDDEERRGPAPRLYFPKLLNWIRWNTAVEIKEDHPALWSSIYTPTPYSELLFKAGIPPHFTRPDLYKHYFQSFHTQFTALEPLSATDRIALLKSEVQSALDLYSRIDAEGVAFFDTNCHGEHLPIWNRLLNKI